MALSQPWRSCVAASRAHAKHSSTVVPETSRHDRTGFRALRSSTGQSSLTNSGWRLSRTRHGVAERLQRHSQREITHDKYQHYEQHCERTAYVVVESHTLHLGDALGRSEHRAGRSRLAVFVSQRVEPDARIGRESLHPTCREGADQKPCCGRKRYPRVALALELD